MFTSGRYYCQMYERKQKKDKRQVNEKLEREYRDCIKSRRDKIGITRHNYHDAPSAIYCAVKA